MERKCENGYSASLYLEMEKWNGDELLQEAVRYFSGSGFQRLLKKIKEKYQSLSRLGGKIIIPELTEEEAESLEGFLQMEVNPGQKLSVSVRQINKAMMMRDYHSSPDPFIKVKIYFGFPYLLMRYDEISSV